MFCICGVPGNASIVNVNEPKAIQPGIRALRHVRFFEQGCRKRIDGKNNDEQADASIGKNRTGQYDSQNGMLVAKFLHDGVRDPFSQKGILHNLPENRTQHKNGEK